MPLARILAAAALAATAALISPGEASADGAADEAELHFEIGAEAYLKGDFRAALEHFLLSNRLVPNRNVVFNIARTYEQLKRYADAYRYYVDALDGETNAQTIATIEATIERIAPNVAVLQIESNPPGATIYLERKDLGSRGHAPKPLAVPEGKYKVIVELPGYEPVTIDDVTAKVGAETRVRPVLAPIVGRVEVAVHGAPGAAVHVDEEAAPPVCIAPCTFETPPGQHLLHFSRRGFQAAPQQVVVIPRGTVKAVAELRPLTGAVVVQADEREAVVEIDGKAAGFTPTVIQNVPVGRRKVTVRLRGHAPIDREIEVRAQQTTQLVDLKLVPLRQVAAASRFTESIDDAPSSVTIIDGQELRAFGYPTLWEALRGIRGVALMNDRTYPSAAIRGLGDPNDFGNRMLVLQDGAVLNDNLLNSTYISTDGRSDLEDIERIEVVRGPGSLLYGANAMSGVINMVPRAKDRPSSVHASVGTYDNAALRGRLGFHYNFTPKIGVWASLSGTRSDGFSVDVQPGDPASGSTVVAHGVDSQRGYGTAGRFWAGPLTVQWYYNQRKHHLPIGAWGSIVDDLGTSVFDERFLGEIRFEPQLTRTLQLSLRAHANYYHYTGEYRYPPPNGSPHDDFVGTWLGAEARFIWTPREGLRLTIGGEVQGNLEASLRGEVPEAPEPSVYMDERRPYNVFSPYVIGEWSATPWLRVSGGARLNAYTGFEPTAASQPPVFRAAAIVKPSKTTILKLIGGNSFRAPSVYEQYYHDGGFATYVATIPGKFSLEPEEIITGEIELTQRFLESWSFLGSVWGSHVENIITTILVDGANGGNTGEPDPTGDTQRYVNKSDPALLTGIDFELRREWRQGWMLSASYGHQRAQYLTGDPALAVNPRLINAPEHLASFRSVVPIVPELLSLGVRLVLEAPRRISLESDETTSPAVVMDAALSGGIRRFGLSYVLAAYNIGDERYDYLTRPSYFSKLSRQNGRTVLLNLTVQYP
ncbi:PEGA domain-containing protein [Polyangium aurulentum]|uniref:PEGA domain-containing protein n=1 Tax=Polyangium aurulentum TaxID=2567896 RepID=UPI0010AE52A3|nr:PEGA domain-containing protein [Polyangium aurulentum]UQA63788.1 TonB-dependent receptor [Polyangium aurulentum]